MSEVVLEIRLLGGFSLLLDGVSVPSPKSRKGKSLVAYLALHRDRSISRDDLAQALWPDKDLEAARFNLRQGLATLRKEAPLLSPYILAPDRSTLCLDESRTVVDVERFRKLPPRDAVNLLRGPLMETFSDEWLKPIREELNERAIRTLAQAAEKSSPIDAVPLVRQALAIDPYRETVQGLLLRALSKCGDQVGAEEAMRRYRLLLHEELRTEPSPELEKEFRILMQASIPRISTSPSSLTHRLPVPPNRILGREKEIEALHRQLKDGRLVTLLGPGGAGKTRLAIAAATEELPQWSNGVWFADFGAIQDEKLVPQALAQSLCLAKRSGESWSDLLEEELREAETLLIFDNCEHLQRSCGALAGCLIQRCPKLKILATSRIPLEIQGEQRFLVDPLELPGEGEVDDEHHKYSALRLFEERARQVSPAFTIKTSNVDQVTRICQQIDAMPLGIEMAAARLASLSLDAIEARMHDKLQFLKSRSELPQRRSLRAVIEWSFGLLSKDAQTLLLRLSAFASGCQAEAAKAVCDFAPLSCGSVLDLLDELVNASLVRFDGGRYTLFDTVKHFAEGRLATSGEGSTMIAQLATYYTDLCDLSSDEYRTVGPDRIAEKFRPELANLRATLQGCLEHMLSEHGLRLALSSANIFTALQLDGEAAEYFKALLESEPRTRELPLRVAALKRACLIYQSQHSDWDRPLSRQNTIAACDELELCANQAQDKEALAEAFINRGRVHLWWNADIAKESLTKAQEICENLPNTHLVLRLLGQLAYDARDMEKSANFYVEAQKFAERAGDVAELIHSLEAEAHLLREMNLCDQARHKLDEIEWILSRRADARAHAFNQMRFAELFLDLWSFEEMREPLTSAQIFFGTSRKRLHGMLIDGLTRYLAAFDHDYVRACEGISLVTNDLVNNALQHPSAYWHGACIELEALAFCLSQLSFKVDALRMFGAAQSLRERDWAFLSPGVQARWKRFVEATGLNLTDEAFQHGKQLPPEEILDDVRRLERKVLSSFQTKPLVAI